MPRPLFNIPFKLEICHYSKIKSAELLVHTDFKVTVCSFIFVT